MHREMKSVVKNISEERHLMVQPLERGGTGRIPVLSRTGGNVGFHSCSAVLELEGPCLKHSF